MTTPETSAEAQVSSVMRTDRMPVSGVKVGRIVRACKVVLMVNHRVERVAVRLSHEATGRAVMLYLSLFEAS